MLYLRGGSKGEGEDAAKPVPHREVRVRDHFPETMYIHPELVTDEKGVAELTIPMADSVTDWRLTALASSADGKLGGAEQALRGFQDFFVDLDMPTALVRGDEVTIPVAVHNYLEQPQTVRLEVKSEPWFQLLSPARLTVTVRAGGVEGGELRLRAVKSGHQRLSLRADGTKLSDAIAREILVSESGQEEHQTVSGTLEAGRPLKVAVAVPPQAVQGSARLLLRVFPGRLASAVDGLEGALAEPHGCFEQTSSTTYPNVMILDYLKKSGKASAEVTSRARRMIATGYQRLISFEVRVPPTAGGGRGSGGFSWFGQAPARQVLTAYGLMEFRDMSRVFPVEEQLIRRTQRWLVAQQAHDGSWRPDDHRFHGGGDVVARTTAYIAWALAESGFRGAQLDKALDYVERSQAASRDPYTAAALLAASVKARPAAVPALARQLAARAMREEQRVRFPTQGLTPYYGRGVAGDIETTALAAYALAVAGREPELTKSALEWIAAHRDHRGTWHTTQGTIQALRALLQGLTPEVDQQVKVRANGEDLGPLVLKSTAQHAVTTDLAARMRTGANVVELTAQERATFQLVASYTLPWREKGRAEELPLALKVDYGLTRAKIGGIVPVDVEVTYRKPEASGMVLVAVGVPAGLTPLDEDLAALQREGRIARYELGPGRVNLYLDSLATGAPVALKLRLKARTRVRSSGVGSLAYLYYSPEIRASAPPAAIQVN
jgi:uncharacterized protein YfaS (alpha-2-macroglobulin family)